MTDDLISRQQAIDALYNVDEYNSRSVIAIKNLPSIQSEQRWIPVTERLPEDSCGCLVTVGFENGLKLVLPSIYTKYDPKETFSIGGSGRVVEAWELYPEPYQGGK